MLDDNDATHDIPISTLSFYCVIVRTTNIILPALEQLLFLQRAVCASSAHYQPMLNVITGVANNQA